MDNPCIQCGKPRIDGKTWKGKIGNSLVIYALTICPDPICQSQVDKAIAERRAKSALLFKEKADAKLARQNLATN